MVSPGQFFFLESSEKRTVFAIGYLFVRAGKVQRGGERVKNYGHSIILEAILTYSSLWYLSGLEKGKKEKYRSQQRPQ